MLVIELAILGGLLYAGSKMLLRRRGDAGAPRSVRGRAAPQESRRDLVVSSVSLGFATFGMILGRPLLSLASLPGLLFVFLPTFGLAWHAVRQRRVGLEVLDATRIIVCVVMGYWVVATLDALLRAAEGRLLKRAESEFRNTLNNAFGKAAASVWVYHQGVELESPAAAVGPGTIVVLGVGDTAPADGVVLDGRGRIRPSLAGGPILPKRPGDPLPAGSLVVSGRFHLSLEQSPVQVPDPHEVLEQAVLGPTPIRRFGERNGERLAPWMLVVFALSIPWLGINRAAAFLTVRCGAQLRDLSPHTARQAIGYGARNGILVRQIRALELASLVNTVVIDARVVTDPAVFAHAAGIIHALRQRPWPMSKRFAVHVLADTEEEGRRLKEILGFDDYFAESSPFGRAALLEDLQLGTGGLCYVGIGDGDTAAMRSSLLAVAHRPRGPLNDSAASIVLTDENLRGLPGLFDLAAAFTARQGSNLFVPIGMDLFDISTTVFLHFGLVYSILLSHAGYLSSLVRARFPKLEPMPELEAPPVAGLLDLPGPVER